ELAKNTATDSSKEGVTDFIERLKELAIPVGKIIAINEQLKKLKVSRQIRAKVIKIFHNYNNGIQDPVLYTYFLDFGFFISNLIKRVKHYSNQFDRILKDNSDYVDINTQEIESNLFKLIDIFQESFNIRMLNCFKYEDITDFDLDFNSSIQQLLTTYNTVAIAIGNNIYAKEEEEVLYGPIVRLNFKNTVSSYDSINYNVYNFLSPEVVFFTVVKEIMNHFSVQKELGFNKEIDILKGDFEKGIKSINYLLDYYESGLIDFDYYFIDIIRYIIVCNHDISLFQYWFWQINLQNSSMYDAIGVMRENHFKVELFRICFLAKLFDEQTFLECPIPELENYWERYYHKTIEAIDLLFDKSPQLITQFRKLTFEQAGRYLQTIQNNDVKEVILSFKSKNNYMTNDSDYKQEQFRKKIDEFIKEIEIESAPREYGFQSKLSFSLTYYNDYLSIFKNLNKQAIEDGQPILYKKETHGHPIAYLNGLMYSYLFHLLEKNKKINFLRRSWSDGKPLKSFIEVSNSDALYFIDQTGSIFFTDSAKVNQYFKMRNGVLQSLFDFSNKQKVQIFKKIKTLMSN
ncbi:MAG TPA: hypothetical protein DCQ50_21175, partial [Chryseobacterium sp.]|nr:hypothetical protein [Chryseobacterium sp.]